MNFQQQLIAQHFQQSEHYYSESKSELIRIADMPRKHAKNAALKLVANALRWAQDAGQDFTAEAKSWDHENGLALLWLSQQPLWQALAKRGTEPARPVTVTLDVQGGRQDGSRGTSVMAAPIVVEDSDGDRWYRCPNGFWSRDRGDSSARLSLAGIRRQYGPLTTLKRQA